MLADTEALDEYFANRYTNGSVDEYLEKCTASVTQTDQYLNEYRQAYPTGSFTSTSFLNQFGPELLAEEESYAQQLAGRRAAGELGRVEKDIERRTGLYNTLYGPEVEHGFLVERTIRTMAQYLALGKLVGCDPQSCLIVHDTVSASLFQDINRYQEGTTNFSTSPVIRRGVRVYE